MNDQWNMNNEIYEEWKKENEKNKINKNGDEMYWNKAEEIWIMGMMSNEKNKWRVSE